MGVLKLDFILLTQPRSGSHMLAFALDSHPDMNMRGELQFPKRHEWSGQGKLQGAIVHPACLGLVSAGKAIVLTRDQARRYSEKRPYIASNGATHYFEPAKVKLASTTAYRQEQCERRQAETLDAAKTFGDTLYITYEELCQHCAGVEFDGFISDKLCEFIGVDSMLLKTRTHRPEIQNSKSKD